jgi:hypothetical protein
LELLLIWFILLKIRSEEDRRKIADCRFQIRSKEEKKKEGNSDRTRITPRRSRNLIVGVQGSSRERFSIRSPSGADSIGNTTVNKKKDLRPARALGRRRSAPRRSRPARVLRSWRAGPSELLTRPRLGAVPPASWFARPALVARGLARPQTLSVVKRQRVRSLLARLLGVVLQNSVGIDCFH